MKWKYSKCLAILFQRYVIYVASRQNESEELLEFPYIFLKRRQDFLLSFRNRLPFVENSVTILGKNDSIRNYTLNTLEA